MKTFKLEGAPRTEMGKKEAKMLRKENMIPAVLNGGKLVDLPYSAPLAEGEKCVPLENGKGMIVTDLKLSTDSVRKLVYSPDIFAIDLKIGNEKEVTAVVKDIQFHPVSGNILHMDFLEISKEKPIVMAVPIALEGHSVGVKAGGKLVQKIRKIKVKALYIDIPEKLTINVDSLELGKSISVGDLHFDKLELVTPKEALVCSVLTTRGSVAAAAES